jgi:hypothetical protein
VRERRREEKNILQEVAVVQVVSERGRRNGPFKGDELVPAGGDHWAEGAVLLHHKPWVFYFKNTN